MDNLDFVVAIAPLARPAIIAVLLMGLWAGVQRTALRPGARWATWLAVAVLLIAWFGVADWLGRSGVYDTDTGVVPLLPLAIVAPLAIGLVLTLRSSRLAAVLDAIPQSWLVGVQVYRMLGLVFLIQLARGLAPWQFALPAGIGDVLTGLFALPVASVLTDGGAQTRAATPYLFELEPSLGVVPLLCEVPLTPPGPHPMAAPLAGSQV
jgi:hypothetical protein